MKQDELDMTQQEDTTMESLSRDVEGFRSNIVLRKQLFSDASRRLLERVGRRRSQPLKPTGTAD